MPKTYRSLFLFFLSESGEEEGLHLEDLLRFITGVSTVPPNGIDKWNQNRVSPTQACFNRLNLPVIHPSFEAFRDVFETALKFGGGYVWVV